MVIANECLQKRVGLFLFLTVLITFIYVYCNTSGRSTNPNLVIIEPEVETSTNFSAVDEIQLHSQLSNRSTNVSLIVTIQVYSPAIIEITKEPIYSIKLTFKVHNRLSYLEQLISSLSTSRGINRALLIFSHDFFDEDMNALINSIKFCQHKQIFFPTAMSNNTNFSIKGKDSEVKLHWWWKANEAFEIASQYGYDGLVLFLEEDHVVAEDFIHVLNKLQEISQNYCINCVYSLSGDKRNFETSNNKFKTSTMMSNMGLAFNRTTWLTINACAEKFCRYDDYNWDWTLNYIFQDCVKPRPKTLIMSGSRVFHIGKCGMHFNNKNCDATTLVKEIQDDIKKFSTLLYPKTLEHTGEIMRSRIVKGFGGFAEKEDQQLCLDFSSHNH